MDPRIVVLLNWYRRRQRHRRYNRRFWVHPINQEALRIKTFEKFYEKLINDETKFFNYFRMSIESFKKLLKRLENSSLPKKNTNMRKCISTKMKLAICLRYLASGCSMKDLHYSYKVGVSTISGIIWDVCWTLWDVLHEEYLRTPSSQHEWMKVVEGFERKTNFPHCLGAIDGKHIRILKPAKSGSMYFNYKDYFSIVLLAIVDSEYRFIYVDIGSYGKDSDSTILKNSVLWKRINDSSLHIPNPTPLSESGDSIPYVFIGDEGFALHNNLLRPFGGTHLDVRKKIFNYRLCRARRYVECAFGILAGKWRILHKAIDVSPSLIIEIVKACIVLHNYVREHDGHNFDEVPSSTIFQNFHSTSVRNVEANSVRSAFAEYFLSNEGSVPWQNEHI